MIRKQYLSNIVIRVADIVGHGSIHNVKLLTGLRNRSFDIFSVEWYIICRSTDLSICRTTNMDLIIMKKA